ncbi:hypothetical protein ASPFODRAFT_35265 [Aspergillus luchuensis CBS 106.47]|uniref:Uncharacterized protein n=1 Tax=Aspergillus luchuensis (strain CBS 106.47) TaxID=1137211 RepID=A0A1M3TAT9_ASPLC|nr:hypothetical protein ASPFODRAFT_35265 [Aspergillus luchuensis CBS 106.47]
MSIPSDLPPTALPVSPTAFYAAEYIYIPCLQVGFSEGLVGKNYIYQKICSFAETTCGVAVEQHTRKQAPVPRQTSQSETTRSSKIYLVLGEFFMIPASSEDPCTVHEVHRASSPELNHRWINIALSSLSQDSVGVPVFSESGVDDEDGVILQHSARLTEMWTYIKQFQALSLYRQTLRARAPVTATTTIAAIYTVSTTASITIEENTTKKTNGKLPSIRSWCLSCTVTISSHSYIYLLEHHVGVHSSAVHIKTETISDLAEPSAMPLSYIGC